jgi:ubiquinone/menaquinone biosynthesis C-methylase UbiE
MATVDKQELEARVKDMYRDVALDPQGDFHFELGRELAEKLGYSPEDLDKIPPDSIDSFAGVGHHFDLADVKNGERVLDMGSGSGMDSFLASLKAGDSGTVVGIDMTDEQLKKARDLGAEFQNVTFRQGYIEKLPVEDGSFDVVISNGVFNLSGEKEKVFMEVSRVLKRGGRLAISDIVSEEQLPGDITCNSKLWASCIGGAMQQDAYKAAIEKAGLRIDKFRDNPEYQFISNDAKGAGKQWGVKSISLVAVKQ